MSATRVSANPRSANSSAAWSRSCCLRSWPWAVSRRSGSVIGGQSITALTHGSRTARSGAPGAATGRVAGSWVTLPGSCTGSCRSLVRCVIAAPVDVDRFHRTSLEQHHDLVIPDNLIPGAEPWSHVGGPAGALVLHGFTGNPGSMRGVAEALAAAGFTVELPLLPGPRHRGRGPDQDDLVRLAGHRRGRYQDLAARCASRSWWWACPWGAPSPPGWVPSTPRSPDWCASTPSSACPKGMRAAVTEVLATGCRSHPRHRLRHRPPRRGGDGLRRHPAGPAAHAVRGRRGAWRPAAPDHLTGADPHQPPRPRGATGQLRPPGRRRVRPGRTHAAATAASTWPPWTTTPNWSSRPRSTSPARSPPAPDASRPAPRAGLRRSPRSRPRTRPARTGSWSPPRRPSRTTARSPGGRGR
jgi:hypothetical protein